MDKYSIEFIEKVKQEYGFTDEVITAIFDYCNSIGVSDKNYILSVAKSWYEHNIRTEEDLELYYQKQLKIEKIKKVVAKKLEKTKLSLYEEAYIEKWVNDFEYDIDIIELALEKTKKIKTSLRFEFIIYLIYNWYDRHLKTSNEVIAFDENLNSDSFDIDMMYALGLIVSRERNIRNFVKTKYYKIIGEFGNQDGTFKAEWKVNETSKMFESPKLYNETAFKKEDDAKQLISCLTGKTAIIKELNEAKIKQNAPLLFNLVEIQNECTKRFKIKPDETLGILQNLYEKKLVTYPRTEARVLSTAVAKEISKNINRLVEGYKDEEVQVLLNRMTSEKYSTDLTKTKYVNDSKITDYYAIIPTGQGFEKFDSLNDIQKQVYKMIVKRFIAIFYPPTEYNDVYATIMIDNEEFFVKERLPIKLGYLEIFSEEIINLAKLNLLKAKQEINVINFEIATFETLSPTRYNSGSIIVAMEKEKIGTRRTRSRIVTMLQKMGYIEINNTTQIISITEKGELIYDDDIKVMSHILN